jgi:hypothetical protein
MASSGRVSMKSTAAVRDWTTVYRIGRSRQDWVPYSSGHPPALRTCQRQFTLSN